MIGAIVSRWWAMSEKDTFKVTIKAANPEKPVKFKVHGAFIEFPDGTEIEVPEESVVVLYDPGAVDG